MALNYCPLCVVLKMLFHRSGNRGEKSLYIATWISILFYFQLGLLLIKKKKTYGS